MNRSDRLWRGALAGLSLVLLAACATPEPGAESDRALVAVEPVVAMLVGEYAGLSWPDGEPGSPVRLRIDRVSAASGVAVLQMRQFDAAGIERRFRISLEATKLATRLVGSFEPLNDDGQALGRCALELIVRGEGVLARTDAASCQFGSGADALALIKEIAHDGDRLVIADRVLAAGTDRAIQPDRMLEAMRVRGFRAWAGSRNGADEPWRMARDLELRSDATPVRPQDAAGMPLGVELDLGLHRISAQGPTVLRLRAFDLESGALLSQAWADPAAVRLGLALPQLQVGLELPGSTQGAGVDRD
jgi:hypothetical protein